MPHLPPCFTRHCFAARLAGFPQGLSPCRSTTYRSIEVDSAHGQTRTPEYLALNPNGKVPMVERDDGRVLVESNAILFWLAEGTPYLPADAWQRAQALS